MLFNPTTSAPCRSVSSLTWKELVNNAIFDGLPDATDGDVVAIDFETANRRRDSACCVGVALVRGDSIVSRGAVLIDPEAEFDAINSRLTGIDSSSVAHADNFEKVWPRLRRLLHGRTVVAHNAGFDVGVLQSMLSRYSLSGVDADVLCTLSLAKTVWPGQPTYSLSKLTQSVGLPRFRHHRADDDAVACAELLLAMCRERSAVDAHDLVKLVGATPRRLRASPETESVRNPPEIAKGGGLGRRSLEGKTVCFTGAMVSMPRKKAGAVVVAAGGMVSGNVSKKVDYLVLGEADFFDFVGGDATTKSKKALQLIDKGASIEIVSEHALWKMFATEDESDG